MALLGMDTARFIQIFIVQLGLGLVYLIMALLVLKRDKKRLNQIISTFYVAVSLGMIINVIYALIEDVLTVTILHSITIYFLFIAPIFLLIFNLVIMKSQKIFDTKKQLIIAGAYAIALLGIYLVPNGITINETTSWKPVWNLTFSIYIVLLATIAVIAPTLYTALKINKKFEDQELKKKWKFYIIGISANFAIFYGTVISNYMNDAGFRLIWALISMLLLLINSIGIYVGIGKQLKKKQQ